MAGKVVNQSFVLLSKFGASRKESASKTATSHIRKPLAATVRINPSNMKLFGKKQWIISIISLIAGLILTGIILNLYFGEIKYWILITTGLIGLLVTFIVYRYSSK